MIFQVPFFYLAYGKRPIVQFTIEDPEEAFGYLKKLPVM